MRYLRMLLLAALFLLLITPAAAIAEVDHSAHHAPAMDNSSTSKESLDTDSVPEPKRAAAQDNGHQSQEAGGHEASGHGGGNPPRSSLEPVKNQVVAGFLGLNALVLIAAAVMKGKKRAGGVHCG